MTLQCECGGAVELTSSTYGDNYATESYQCASCGDSGTLSMGPNGDKMTGCLTENGAY